MSIYYHSYRFTAHLLSIHIDDATFLNFYSPTKSTSSGFFPFPSTFATSCNLYLPLHCRWLYICLYTHTYSTLHLNRVTLFPDSTLPLPSTPPVELKSYLFHFFLPSSIVVVVVLLSGHRVLICRFFLCFTTHVNNKLFPSSSRPCYFFNFPPSPSVLESDPLHTPTKKCHLVWGSVSDSGLCAVSFCGWFSAFGNGHG